MNLSDVVALVRAAELPGGDYAIFGSGPLLVRGIITSVNDIDVLARGAAWERALEIGEITLLPEHGVSVAILHGGALTIGQRWAIGEIDPDQAIDSADCLLELPWVRLELVAGYKRVAARPKDLEHLRLLAEWGDSGGAH